MRGPKKLILIGDSAFAEIAYEYFTHDSDYEIVGFAVESKFRKRKQLFGIPVVNVEDMESIFQPDQHSVYVAIVYTQLNRLRTRLMNSAKSKGYFLASYISSRAFIWSNVQIGEHCFIFEDNTIQPFVTLERNIVLWSGNHIGHHSIIKRNCFISSHVVISGFCTIEENCFIGVNATISNNVTIAKDNWLGPQSLVLKDTKPMSFYKSEQARLSSSSAERFLKPSMED